MKYTSLVTAVVVLSTFLSTQAAAVTSSALCKGPSTTCQPPSPFAVMVTTATQKVQAIHTSLSILQQRKTFASIQRLAQGGQCVEDIYNTNKPQDNLTCEGHLRELSKDLTFLNRFNLHYSSKVCKPTLAKTTNVVTRYLTTRIARDLDTAVCTLKNILNSSQARSIGIAVNTSTGQPSCYDLAIGQFQTALFSQSVHTVGRLAKISVTC